MQQRLRDLGITIGQFPTGEFNAITDIPGVTVGHCTVIHDKPRIARTGVTMVLPRGGDIWHNYAFAGYHSFNGNGEMTGIPWLKESGMLGSPIGLTNTHQVGIVRDALVERSVQLGEGEPGGGEHSDADHVRDHQCAGGPRAQTLCHARSAWGQSRWKRIR